MDDLGEKTEDATPKRRQEARDDGKIAKSQDLSSAIMLLAITVVIWMAGSTVLGQFKTLVQQMLDGDAVTDPMDAGATGQLVAYLGTRAVRIALPILLITWAVGFLVQFMQVGVLLTGKPIQPDLGKLDPIKGFQRIFGISGLVKAALDTLKVAIVLLVAGLTIYQYKRDIVVLPVLPLLQAISEGGALMLQLAFRVLAVLLVLGIIDYAYQRWKLSRDLRMSKQQVKDEMKQSDGDPEVKRRRMRMQQQITMQRIGAAVPRADVIVTNPEHISIAIKYDAATMAAPTVVAKGADLLAFRIRQIAQRHGIPIVERKPLARALYRQVEVGQEVPSEFYQAVAEILAFVYQMGGGQTGGQTAGAAAPAGAET